MKSVNKLSLLVAPLVLWTGVASADTCGANLTGTFTAAQATKLCSTFGGSGSLIPSANNTYDIGSAALSFRSGYFDTNLVVSDIRSGVATGQLVIIGGAANSAASGSRLITEGVSAAGTGDIVVSTSSGADADIFLDLNAAASDVNVRNLGGTTVASITQAGAISSASTIRSTATADIGWTAFTGLVNATCNTQCTSACVIGLDTDGAKSTFVACSAATAENCLCAGAS